jgi:hypothetical protein
MGVCGLILGGRTLTLRFLRNEKGLLLANRPEVGPDDVEQRPGARRNGQPDVMVAITLRS